VTRNLSAADPLRLFELKADPAAPLPAKGAKLAEMVEEIRHVLLT
jgi:hypothetical protein